MAEGGFFKRLLAGLTKTRDNFVKNMDYIFRGFTNIDDEFYEELEEILTWVILVLPQRKIS